MGNLLSEPGAAHRNFKVERYDVDLVVVGGGMSGTCCALTAARAGATVVLIQDRPMVGGNASSEVRLWIMSAVSHGQVNNRWAREGGVIDEIIIDNTFRNPEGNPVLFDTILLEKVAAEPNHHCPARHCGQRSGEGARADYCRPGLLQFEPEIDEVRAALFCDSSGDGALRIPGWRRIQGGSRVTGEIDEPFAPSRSPATLLGQSIYFTAKMLRYRSNTSTEVRDERA